MELMDKSFICYLSLLASGVFYNECGLSNNECGLK